MIWLLALLVLLPASADAATRYVRAGGSNTTGPANSCASTDVQEAITNATDGDTIQIGAGSCTWTAGVSNAFNAGTPSFTGTWDTVRWVKIYGAGTLPLVGATADSTTGTTITDNVSGGSYCCVIVLRESTAGNVELANITLVLIDGYPKYDVIGWEPGTVGVGVAGAKVHLMHHMTFTDNRGWNNVDHHISIISTARGVMYRNKFVRADATQTAHAIFSCNGATALATWFTPSTLGSADTNGDRNFYFEDNQAYNYWQNGVDETCRAVVRGNRLQHVPIGGHGKDSNTVGIRSLDYYLNTTVCDGNSTTTNVDAWVTARGGVQMVHNNTMDALIGNSSCKANHAQNAQDIVVAYWGIRSRESGGGCYLTSAGAGGSYPAPLNYGWGYVTGATTVDRYYYPNASPDNTIAHDPTPGNLGLSGSVYHQDLEGSYYWNNYRSDGTTKISSDGTTADGGIGLFSPDDTCGFGLLMTTFIQEDREWYKQNDSFTGAAGIGIGPRASRPASTTNGVAWWATDQGGNWNTTTVNANDGCLDKVVSGAWVNCVAYDQAPPTGTYTPYRYPHDLATVTGSAAGGTVAPPGRRHWHGPHAKPDRRETP